MKRHSIDPVKLSQIIDQVYNCVLDRSLWAESLEELCPLVGACAASLNIHTLSQQAPELLVEYGTDQRRSEAYVTEYGRGNPLINAALLYLHEGDVRTLYSDIDISEFRQTRFYKEWVAPQGWGDWMAGMLYRSASTLAMLAVVRRDADGPFTEQDLALMRMLMPHIQKATVLGRLFIDQQTKLAGISALVERIKVAAFLVDRSGHIAYSNAKAAKVLSEGAIFREQNGKLVALDPVARQLLRKGLTGVGRVPLTMIVPQESDQRSLSIIPPSEESGGNAIVTVSIPEENLPLPGPVLMESYGLTAAELRVLMGLVQGRTLATIAAELSITPRTVKAHLQKLFSKTATKRQADLIRKVLSLSPPLRLF